MPKKSHAVQITPHAEQPSLSKSQKRFNSLIKKLDQQKKLLHEWTEATPEIQRIATGEYEPLYADYRAQEIRRLRVLDEALTNPLFKKRDKEKLRHLICENAAALIRGGDDDDDELKELYNRHSGSDIDEEMRRSDAHAEDLVKSMMGEILGMDLSQHDLGSPEQLTDFIEQQAKAADAEREARRANHKKTKRQEALEAKRAEEESRIKQSIQEIYRKLAARLHPDREPDPAERERKTELMKQANQAYEKKDLLQLLELQLQAEHIDQSHIDQLSEDRLKAYNQILKEQSEELQKEISEIEFAWRMQLNLAPFETVTPKGLMGRLRGDIRHLRHQIADLKDQLVALGDPQILKAWLKGYRIPKQTGWDD
ncbi:MAG: hypothetical protein FIA97_09210, partial [Methylococcaceae bacterium]|nr:hypothetical protein [Methylococcaceae bacterium]